MHKGLRLVGLNNYLNIPYIFKYCENKSSGKQSYPRSLFKASIYNFLGFKNA